MEGELPGGFGGLSLWTRDQQHTSNTLAILWIENTENPVMVIRLGGVKFDHGHQETVSESHQDFMTDWSDRP
jgi:hypothetical protein